MPRHYLTGIVQLLTPFPGRLEFSIRLALICALTTMVATTYQTPDAALTTYIVFFMNKPDRVTSLILNVAMVILISLVIGFSFLLIRIVIDEPFWRVGCITVVSFVFLFLASASKLQPVASILALIVAYVLDLVGTSPTAELVTRGLLYAWLFIGIPAGISIVVNLLGAPAPRRLAENALAERLSLAAAMLRRPDQRASQQLQSYLYEEGMVEIQKHLKLASLERTSPKADIAALTKAAQSTTAIVTLVDMIDREQIPLPEEIRTKIATTLDDMAIILRKGEYPIQIDLDVQDFLHLTSPLGSTILLDIQKAISGFAEPPIEAHPAEAKKAGGFFVADAFTNPDHVRYALKATAAAMICYLLYSLLNWPGIHTCFLTCYIVSLGTTAETVEKLTLRITGCLVGAVAGIAAIVFIMPHLTSIGELMALVFIAACISGWVAGGTPRISYAGFQTAFAFFLCIIQGAKPAFDLVTARDRVIGILLGNFVVYLIFTNLWPTSVKQRIDVAIAKLLRVLGDMVTTTGISTRLALVSQTQSQLGAIEQDLLIANYEPKQVRPDENWIETRHQAIAQAKGLVAPLYLEAGCDTAAAASSARELKRSAQQLAPPAASVLPAETEAIAVEQPPQAALDAAAIDLRTQIEPRLRELRTSLVQPPSTEYQAVNYASA